MTKSTENRLCPMGSTTDLVDASANPWTLKELTGCVLIFACTEHVKPLPTLVGPGGHDPPTFALKGRGSTN